MRSHSCLCAETRAHPQAGREREGPWHGQVREGHEQAGGQGEAAAVIRETAEINRHGRRQLGGRTDDLIGLRVGIQ